MDPTKILSLIFTHLLSLFRGQSLKPLPCIPSPHLRIPSSSFQFIFLSCLSHNLRVNLDLCLLSASIFALDGAGEKQLYLLVLLLNLQSQNSKALDAAQQPYQIPLGYSSTLLYDCFIMISRGLPLTCLASCFTKKTKSVMISISSHNRIYSPILCVIMPNYSTLSLIFMSIVLS